ncbi:MAG: helix-turn-helix domain-containing protein [Verrucomicrobiae bacterium]
MSDEKQWSLSLLEQVEINPRIAYCGQPDLAWCDCERTLQHFTWWEVRSGCAQVTTTHGTVIVEAGEWLLIPHGVWRHQVLKKGTHLTSLNFQAVWPNGRPVLTLLNPITGPNRNKLATLARSVCRVVNRTEANRAKPLLDREVSLSDWLSFRSLLLSFFNELVKCAMSKGGALLGPSSGDSRLDTILSELRRDLYAGPLPYTGWGARLGVGRSQIDRLAQRYLGCGLKTIRDAFLQDEIRHHFALGKLSAKELAAKFHFSDAAHFSRWVQRATGHSPKDLRHMTIENRTQTFHSTWA